MDGLLQQLQRERADAEARYQAALLQLQDVPADRFETVVHPATLSELDSANRDLRSLGDAIWDRVCELSKYQHGSAGPRARVVDRQDQWSEQNIEEQLHKMGHNCQVAVDQYIQDAKLHGHVSTSSISIVIDQYRVAAKAALARYTGNRVANAALERANEFEGAVTAAQRRGLING
jgi:hypothetical protein